MRIDSQDVSASGSPELAMDLEGNAIALWEGAHAVWAKRFTPNAGWGSPALLQSGDLGDPVVSVNGKGVAAAVWLQLDGPGSTLRAARFEPTTGWRGAQTVVQSDRGPDDLIHSPDVAIDDNGNAIAVWAQQRSTTDQRVWASRFTLGTGWGAATAIESRGGGRSYMPKVGSDRNGNAIAIWRREEGGRFMVLASRFQTEKR